MLAPSGMPKEFEQWNVLHGAPFGRSRPNRRLIKWLYSKLAWERLLGPFAIQENNVTRTFEYPWAYYAARSQKPRRIVEIGGGLSGFQFVLSKEGHEVINIDPGLGAAGVGWKCDQPSIAKLNALFGTNVVLKNDTIDKANLPSDHFDTMYSISVIEHLPDADVRAVFEHARRCLVRGGKFVITLDLFLNLVPFCGRATNEFGRNWNVREMVEQSGMKLVQGERSQLYGFPEFDKEAILCNLEQYMVGRYPVLTQCMVLEKG